MKIDSFLQFFSSNLRIACNENITVDNCGYEVISSGNIETFMKKVNYDPLSLIPEKYIAGTIDFIIEDVSDEEYKKIELEIKALGIENTDNILRMHNLEDAYDSMHDVCKILRREERLEWD